MICLSYNFILAFFHVQSSSQCSRANLQHVQTWRVRQNVLRLHSSVVQCSTVLVQDYHCQLSSAVAAVCRHLLQCLDQLPAHIIILIRWQLLSRDHKDATSANTKLLLLVQWVCETSLLNRLQSCIMSHSSGYWHTSGWHSFIQQLRRQWDTLMKMKVSPSDVYKAVVVAF